MATDVQVLLWVIAVWALGAIIVGRAAYRRLRSEDSLVHGAAAGFFWPLLAIAWLAIACGNGRPKSEDRQCP